MTSPTPLDSSSDLSGRIPKPLCEKYWLTSLEEFVDLLEGPNQKYGTGLAALTANPGNLPVGRLPKLLETARAALPEPLVREPRQISLGTLLGSSSQAGPAQQVRLSAGLPAEFRLAAALPEPRDQGARPAGLAFALAAMLQQLSGAEVELSAQFLDWASALYRERDGDELGPALRALGELGVCRASTWPYDPEKPGRVPPPGAVEEARQWRAGEPVWLDVSDQVSLKAALHSGRAVLLVLPAHQHWRESWQALRLGRVRAPLPGEEPLGQQALLAVGYRNDPSAPGGFYLIARNSWGARWGAANPDGPGHAHIPYELVQKDGQAALTLAPAQPAALPSAGLPEQARALVEEAQALLSTALPRMARLQELIQQLQGPAGRGAAAQASAPAAPASAAELAGGYGPLIVPKSAQPDESSPLAANGILARTGQPLLDIDAGGAGRVARAERPADDPHGALHAKRKSADEKVMGTVEGRENNLCRALWAVVVHAQEDAALLKALSPLIRKRCEDQGLPVPALDDFQPGETCIKWLSRKVKDLNAPLKSGVPVLVYRTGDEVTTWLARHGVKAEPVKPSLGVPFYLMLVGRPGSPQPGDQVGIPFSFQYALDLFWGVGRLCFTDPQTGQHDLAAYTRYAAQVVAFEQRAQPPFGRHVVYFGTEHPTDTATKLSSTELVQPLAGLRDSGASIIQQYNLNFSQDVFLGKEATHAQLGRVLKGEMEHGRPALLFTATHGVGLPPDDPKLAAYQGALLCQDWPGQGPAQREHWFAAEDLPEQGSLEGLMAFCFACYGVGSPQRDEFAFASDQPRAVAPYPLVAQLPQRLLERGALAVLGHVDRAWSHSFRKNGVNAQTQRFESVLVRLMQGDRAGLATDQFNMVQGQLSVELADLLMKIKVGLKVSDAELGSLWVARNDARNYALLGDPAVRLPFHTGE